MEQKAQNVCTTMSSVLRIYVSSIRMRGVSALYYRQPLHPTDKMSRR